MLRRIHRDAAEYPHFVLTITRGLAARGDYRTDRAIQFEPEILKAIRRARPCAGLFAFATTG